MPNACDWLLLPSRISSVAFLCETQCPLWWDFVPAGCWRAGSRTKIFTTESTEERHRGFVISPCEWARSEEAGSVRVGCEYKMSPSAFEDNSFRG